MSEQSKNVMSDILDKKVSSYTSTSFLKLLDSTSMTIACSAMQKNNKDEIIVVDNTNTPVGIVTDQDVLKKIGEAHANPKNTKLEDIMTFPLVSIKHNDTLLKALKIMRDNRLRKIAVTEDNGNIIGIIYQHTITNLIRQKISSKSQTNYSIRAILWNLGTVTQFAGILMLIPSLVASYSMKQ